MTRTIYIRVEKSVYDEVKKIADGEDRPISYVAARILRMSLPNNKPGVKERKDA